MKKLIKPYELNKSLVFQAPVKVSDGAGGFTTTWLSVGSVSAAVWPISATEIIKNDKNSMDITHRVRIRYRKGIKPFWRISYQDRYLNIISIINPDESNEMLDILCKEAA